MSAQAAVASVVSLPAVAVKDEKGNIMQNQPLSVVVQAGGGSLSGAPGKTGAGAATPLGQWTLGSKSGVQSVTVSSGVLPAVTLTVQALAGPAAKISASSPPPSTGTVGANLASAVVLLVQDVYDNPAEGATVQFSVAGGGQLAAPAASVTSSGTVTVPAWTLGTLRGTNTLTATTGSLSWTHSVVAVADVPASIQVGAGDQQRGFAGALLAVAPSFNVLDKYGNAVSRTNVTFSVVAGGGTVAGSVTVPTDTNGNAISGGWRLGKRNEPQSLRATAGAVASTVTASVRSDFNVEVRFYGTGMTDAQKELFRSAAARVTGLVTGDVPSVTANNFDLNAACGVTGQPLMNESVDDLIIYAAIQPIDGAGSILARAGACGFRGASSLYLPAVGRMEFDAADLQELTGSGSLEDVITHEMLHVVGISRTFWDVYGYLLGYPGADPRYWGPSAIASCRTMGGSSTCAGSIPIEGTGGAGTAGSHWRESTFDNELMTGYINAGSNPLSVMSIASLTDIGYTVNLLAADSYTLSSALRGRSAKLVTGSAWEELTVGGRILESPGVSLEPLGRLRLP